MAFIIITESCGLSVSRDSMFRYMSLNQTWVQFQANSGKIFEKHRINEPTQEVSKWPTPTYRKAGIQELICPFIQLTLPTLTQKKPPALSKSPPYRNQHAHTHQSIQTNTPIHPSTHPPKSDPNSPTLQICHPNPFPTIPEDPDTRNQPTNPSIHPSTDLSIYI